jgi:predicted PP-loop superfamily ATPase
MYKLLLVEREETARVKKVIKQIEEDQIHNLLLSERKKKRQLRDKQHYVDREKIQMKERELMKEMEKVREAREKLQIEKREREHHFNQLSPWNLPVGQAKEQFDKKLPEEISLDVVCSGGTDTSSVEMTNNPETKSITSSMISEKRNMTKTASQVDTTNSSSNKDIHTSGHSDLVEVDTRDVSTHLESSFLSDVFRRML